jgi:hypothetical protein
MSSEQPNSDDSSTNEENPRQESQPPSEHGQAWVGSDSTSHTFERNGFRNKSEIALAVAVDDRGDFNTKYRNVIEEKSQSYGFSPKRPVLKTHTIHDNASEWDHDNILSDFVESLLEIDNILNIHVTITTITNQMIESYSEGGGPREHLAGDDLHNEIRNYYHLISIWDYLEEYRDAPWGTDKVLVDDFEGKDNYPWRQTGKISADLNVIPRGDYTYPILSLADLTMDYIKENVDEWSEDEIAATLIDATPEDSAFVNTKGIHTPEELEEITPIARRRIKRSKHYPHPIVFISRGGIPKSDLMNYDIYHEMAEFVYENDGCMKFFNPSEDEEVLTSEDYLVCLGDSHPNEHQYYNDYNNTEDDIVLTAEEVFDTMP